MNDTPGLFLTFEGIDFTGKSTISKKVVELLHKAGYRVHWTREPGGSALAENIRNVIINGEMDKTTEAMLFAAARNDHYQNTVLPRLHNGEIVISDRFYASSYVYQGVVADNLDTVKELHRLIGNPTPDHTFLITVTLAALAERMKNREGHNRLDDYALNNLTKMSTGFLQYTQEHDNCTTVSNDGLVDTAIYACLSKINTLIKQKGITL